MERLSPSVKIYAHQMLHFHRINAPVRRVTGIGVLDWSLLYRAEFLSPDRLSDSLEIVDLY